MVRTIRMYTVPWGLRHVMKWAADGLAFVANGFKSPGWERGIEAFTPGPFTLLLTKRPAMDLLRHEAEHQMQYQDLGLWRYWRTWIVGVWRDGYMNSELEREARKAAGQE